MSKDKIKLINSREMLDFLDSITQDAQFTKGRELYNGRNLIAKQIKAEI